MVTIRPSYGVMSFGVRIWARSARQVWLAGGSCVPDGTAWTCRPDTDGAPTIRLEAAGSGLRLDNPGTLKVYDGKTGPGLATRLIGGEQDRAFLLAPAVRPADTCRPLG